MTIINTNSISGINSITAQGASGVAFYDSSGSSERLRITSGGRILKGLTTARDNLANNASGVSAEFQIEGTSFTASTLSVIRNSNDANDGGIILGKTRATSTGGNTVVQAGDDLGALIFAGSDGTSLQFGAEILAEVQSGVGNDDMPTDLIFKTNGGTTDTTERLRITSGGNVNIGGNFTETSHQLNISDSTKPSLCLHTGTTQRADFSATSGITSIRSFSNSPFTINIGGSGETEAFRITGDGNFGFGTNTPSQTSSGRTVLSIDGTANSLLNFSHGGTLTGFIYGANDEFRFESNATKPLIFKTAGGTALTIDANAKLILPTGSPGIQFGTTDNPAASGGVDIGSQTLDDYEEGTWTPTVHTGGFGLTIFGNRYVKIGSQVTVWAYVTLTGSGSSAIFQIGGLPYTSITNNYSPCVADFGRGGKKGAYGRVDSNATTMSFLYSSENPSVTRPSLIGNEIGSNQYFIFSVSYFAA